MTLQNSSWSHHQLSEPLLSIIAEIVFLRRPNAKAVCPMSLLKSNVLDKSTNHSVTLRFCMHFFDNSTDHQDQRYCRSISPKAVMIFPKNFLDFRSDTTETHGIINLSSNISKSYAFLCCSKWFWWPFSWRRGGWSLSSISLLCFVYSVA